MLIPRIIACHRGGHYWDCHPGDLRISQVTCHSSEDWAPTDETLQWRQNGHNVVSNHQPRDCFLNRLFRRRSKKTSKLRVTYLSTNGVGNSSVTGEFPAQMASKAKNVSIWWTVAWRTTLMPHCIQPHLLARGFEYRVTAEAWYHGYDFLAQPGWCGSWWLVTEHGHGPGWMIMLMARFKNWIAY